jgi:hypothetical protein
MQNIFLNFMVLFGVFFWYIYSYEIDLGDEPSFRRHAVGSCLQLHERVLAPNARCVRTGNSDAPMQDLCSRNISEIKFVGLVTALECSEVRRRTDLGF